MDLDDMPRIEISDMIDSLKVNIKNLAEYMNNQKKFIRNESRDTIEMHWELISKLDDLDNSITMQP